MSVFHNVPCVPCAKMERWNAPARRSVSIQRNNAMIPRWIMLIKNQNLSIGGEYATCHLSTYHTATCPWGAETSNQHDILFIPSP